jgi:hypothetical protein
MLRASEHIGGVMVAVAAKALAKKQLADFAVDSVKRALEWQRPRSGARHAA